MYKIILVYHGIWSNDLRMEVPFKIFEQQINYLGEKWFQFLSIEALLKSRKKSVSVVFDDWIDTSTSAIDLLESKWLEYWLALITKNIWKKGFLERWYIKSLKHAHIYSHTEHHGDLTTIAIDILVKELENSKLALESIFEKKVDVLVYPMWKYNRSILDQAKKMYRYGLWLLPFHLSKTSENFALPRLNIHGNLPSWKFEFFVSRLGNMYLHLSFAIRKLLWKSYLE